jgi:hypothetical protein
VAPESITTNRNFKVKHGLDVADGGTFGSTVTVATPTENSHAATKLYVDTAVGSPQIPVSDTQPISPDNGDLWFDTVTQRVHVYYSSQWIAIATLEDAETLQDHIHDTSIDGTGLVVSRFIDAGFYYEPGVLVSAGLYNTTEFEATYDGGIATDNFN